MDTSKRRKRWGVLALIGAGVLLGHTWLGFTFSATVAEWRETPSAVGPVEVTVAGALRPTKPVRRLRAPPAPPASPPTPAPLSSTTATSAATATGEPADAGLPVVPVVPVLPAATAPASPASEAAVASAEGATAGADASGTPRVIPSDPWPPSTRIRYSLRGNYRGDFSGSATVLWLRDGPRYRVEMDISIGPRSAALFGRKVTSEGSLSAKGLVPQRYEEETKVLFSRTRRVGMQFDFSGDGEMTLQDGSRRPAPAGTQDSASQFVQLAWLMGTHPTVLKPGDRIGFPLALSRRSDQWTYVIGDPITVNTPAGPVETIHARPQREVDPLRRDLVAEVWFAPALQYLPVRMRVMVDADTFAILEMDGLPELIQTAPPGGAQSPVSQPSASTN